MAVHKGSGRGDKMDRNTYPPGWNKQRVQEVLDHLETRTEEETIAEDEAAFEQDYTAMQVPRKLVPVVRQLIALME